MRDEHLDPPPEPNDDALSEMSALCQDLTRLAFGARQGDDDLLDRLLTAIEALQAVIEKG